MDETIRSRDSFSSCSSDDDLSISSDMDNTTESSKASCGSNDSCEENESTSNRSTNRQNIILKLLNRERNEYFSESQFMKINQNAFNEVPSQLRVCLMEIVPYCYLKGHVFLGLTACGKFLLSYKVMCLSDLNEHNYDFSTLYKYKYELFFWIYRPHNLLSKYYKVCLFDDHGVNYLKFVTMAQWHSNPRTLIVHGANEFDTEASYFTIVSIPKLGCLDCKKLRDEFYADTLDGSRSAALCIRCNLTIHTKYKRYEWDVPFRPEINLNCPDHLIIFSDGLIHVVNVELELNKQLKRNTNCVDISYLTGHYGKHLMIDCHQPHHHQSTAPTISDGLIESTTMPMDRKTMLDMELKQNTIRQKENDTIKPKENIVAKIIADFAECESNDFIVAGPSCLTASSIEKNQQFEYEMHRQQYEQFIISCNGGSGGSNNGSISTSTTAATTTTPAAVQSNPTNRVRLISHRSHRILARSLNTNATTSTTTATSAIKTVDLQSSSSSLSLSTIVPSSSSSSSITPKKATTIKSPTTTTTTISPIQKKNFDRAAKAYEFSEDNEKCEKISTFRKRRLADKKYEFSEDNSENIIPFTKLRSNRQRQFPMRLNAIGSGSTTGGGSLGGASGTGGAAAAATSVIRSTRTSGSMSSPHHHHHYHLHTGYHSGGSGQTFDIPPHTHRASPSHGFRSPCGSPVGNRFLMSPPGRPSSGGGGGGSGLYHGKSPTYTKPFLSPRQHVGGKRSYLDLFDTSSTNLLLSPRSDDFEYPKLPTAQPLSEVKPSNSIDVFPIGLINGSVGGSSPTVQTTFTTVNGGTSLDKQSPEKNRPNCSKKLIRRYVDEDDATSVITSEEDDCISPGYHTSLPVEVHGACYSTMQMVSKTSHQQLKCPSVIIAQHTFDLEMLSYHIATYLCSKNEKECGFCNDWAYAPVNICPLSCTLTCILIVNFTADDRKLCETKRCTNCKNGSNTNANNAAATAAATECHQHQRQQYECSALFEWNIETGDWDVLDYGEMIEIVSVSTSELNSVVNKMALEFSNGLYSGSSNSGNNGNNNSNNKNSKNNFNNNNNQKRDIFKELRVLDSCTDKSKERLIDLKNSIEFYRSTKSKQMSFSINSAYDFE